MGDMPSWEHVDTPGDFGHRTLPPQGEAGSNASDYPRPSSALKDAGPEDQVFVRPGRYEDKIFLTERSVLLVGAGRDQVEVFSRRGGPLYLQRVTGGRISGMTFRN